MPKAPRTSEEVELVKQNILENALQILSKYGYEGFTMRRLAKCMGMTATNIYHYFASKDEIFLEVRTNGFKLMYQQFRQAYDSQTDPFARLKTITDVAIRFAIQNPHHYKIMFTADVPRYKQFVGTPLEPVASEVLRSSMPSSDLVICVMGEIAEVYHNFPKEEARLQYTHWWAGAHGIVSLYNSTNLDYIHENPANIIKPLTDLLLKPFHPSGISQ